MKAKQIHIPYLIVLLTLFYSCETAINTPQVVNVTQKQNPLQAQKKTINLPKNRIKILENLKQKIANEKPLVAHILVPLCDNDNQGIVPVSKALGDGMNITSNLYWGALYGIKTHFKKSKDWVYLESIPKPNKDVLERVIFKKKFTAGHEVILVADAYRGDRMKDCLQDFFAATAGKKAETISTNSQIIKLYSDANLIGFNGHNGLMDFKIDIPHKENETFQDAVIIGCLSHDYFIEPLKKSGAYPLLTTTGLMAPEAYVFEGILNSWGALQEEKSIHSFAARAYHKYQKCGMRGATNLFQVSW